jgi:hypothetical protein
MLGNYNNIFRLFLQNRLNLNKLFIFLCLLWG